MSVEYGYSVEADMASACVDIQQLCREVQGMLAACLISIDLDRRGKSFVIVFAEKLNDIDKTVLDHIVWSHSPEELPMQPNTDNIVGVLDGARRY